MKLLKQGLGLVLLGASLSAVPTLQTAAVGAPATADDTNLVQQMRSAADDDVVVRKDPATGKVGFVRAEDARGDLLPDLAADGRADAVAKADAYVDDFAPAFGAPAGQLQRSEVSADRSGWSITYEQSYQGIPVFAGELKAHVDKQGQLTAVNGFVAPDLGVSTTPRITESQAADRALRMVKDRPSGYEDALPQAASQGLEVRSNELMIYRTGSTRGIDGEARLAWVLEVWNKSTARETVILDAQTGKHLNRWSMMAHALDRELYEEEYTPDTQETLVWAEGDEFPGSLDEDQQNEVLGTAEAYWLFKNTFGYDAWDGQGGQMITVNNDPTISCPNANWNGVTTNYCSGVTGDDTVAHEWGHAYTESTSGLIYQWQSGAMNEAYSDIWGETVDMLNARHNEGGETPGDTRLREPGKCSIYQPAAYELGVTIIAPEEIAGPCESQPGFGPELEGTQTVEVVVAQDAEGDGDTAVNGCTSPYTNAADVAGKWVYVERGFCSFQVKADNAVANGAVGLIVGNNQPGLITMAGTSTIPAFMITQERGDAIESVDGPVTMEIERIEDENATDDTYRWLSGESDPAFGGAIRDMWNPNCFGDPGQVSDAEYHCTVDDNGGVHTNSGVVNRTFAIMVDGFEPSGVNAIGLDKAANLFWHTQKNHLTPISGFPELAEGLEASCAELTGQPINKLTLGNPDPDGDGSDGEATPERADPITQADCEAVSAAIAETELRTEPVQCNFQPMLEQGQLTCGEGYESTTTWTEDFEDGLEGWEQDFEFGNYGGIGFPQLGGHVHHPWVTTTELPETTPLPGGGGTHPQSTVAHAPDPSTGSCAGDENDESSRDGLISPAIEVPDGFQPRFSFDHLMASEATWDGGNVKVSLNGGAFAEVPSQAWLFNGPHGQFESAAGGNSNPLAGQTAFTGTDGGEPTGSWGTSVISLGRLGAAPGDEVQFRFDFGRDGCNGVDGWYVDDLRVTICEEEASTPAPVATETDAVTTIPNPVKAGKGFNVKVKVTADEGTPTGKVQITKDGEVIGTGTLQDGVAMVKVTKGIKQPGQVTLVAEYLGSDEFEPSEDQFEVNVVKKKRR